MARASTKKWQFWVLFLKPDLRHLHKFEFDHMLQSSFYGKKLVCDVYRYECSLPVWSCAWNADDRNYFYAGLQNGTVLVFDIRNLSEPVITLNQDTGSRSPVVSVQYMPGTSGNSIRYSHCCGGHFLCPECESLTIAHTHILMTIVEVNRFAVLILTLSRFFQEHPHATGRAAITR